jgi:hypothetical protein
MNSRHAMKSGAGNDRREGLTIFMNEFVREYKVLK